MSSSYGDNIRLTIFGQSHSQAIGMVLEGIPAGSVIDMDELKSFLSRRAPGHGTYSTPRKEQDIPEFLSGLLGNTTCGTPIAAMIRNNDIHPNDYDDIRDIPRPGHADYTAEVKYHGHQDRSGGGHFSGRLTAPLCIAGGICKQLLHKEGIDIISRISSIGPIQDQGDLNKTTADKDFPVIDDERGKQMMKLIDEMRTQGDSIGGTIECHVLGLPAGLGDPIFDGMENKLSHIIFGIPAIKGIEFGAGFSCSTMTGSENNDEYVIQDGNIRTKTNNCGGILGGITNGMPLTFKVAVKPTPSIAKKQKSIDMKTRKETVIAITGRHDACIVPRAVPCVEAAAAIAIYDSLLGRKIK